MQTLLAAALLAVSLLSAPPTVTAQPGMVDPYQTRYELLCEATRYTGVIGPEQAATVWATGLQSRSAALQYTVMTAALQEDYARQLDAQGSNWVTGMSSPWVDNFAIYESRQSDDSHTVVSLIFDTMTSAGPDDSYKARLWIVREGEFWRIEKIRQDEGLYPYTLYKP